MSAKRHLWRLDNRSSIFHRISTNRILAEKSTLISWNTGVTHYRPSNHQTEVFFLPQIWFGHLTQISDSLVCPSAFDCSLLYPVCLPGKGISTKTEKGCVQTSHPGRDFVTKGKLPPKALPTIKLAVIFQSTTFSIEIGVESEPDCILTLSAIHFLSLNKCCTFCVYFCIEMWNFEFKTCL